jgi:hypothetical protein
MTIDEVRLEVALDMTARVCPVGTPAADRLAAFTRAYEAVRTIGQDDPGAATALDAAWTLVRPAVPLGMAVDHVADALATGYAQVAAAIDPAAERRGRPRRDA